MTTHYEALGYIRRTEVCPDRWLFTKHKQDGFVWMVILSAEGNSGRYPRSSAWCKCGARYAADEGFWYYPIARTQAEVKAYEDSRQDLLRKLQKRGLRDRLGRV